MRKKFIRNILAICFLFAAIPELEAQEPVNIEPHGFALGFNFGMTDLWGNVGTQSILDHYYNKTYWGNTHYMGGLYARYCIHPALAVRLGASYGTLYATDDWNYAQAIKSTNMGTDAFQRYMRGQDIKDNIWEGDLLFEFNPLRLDAHSKVAHKAGQPELLFGVGYFHFKPFSTWTSRETGISQYVNISDLHLDGNGFPGGPAPWDLWQITIPVGIGWHWDIGDHVNLGVEYLWHYTMINYLDGGVAGTYVDPATFDKYLPADKAYIAKEMEDKTWEKGYVGPYTSKDLRGNLAVNNSFSTISVSVYYRFNVHTTPWWGGE